MATTKDKLGRPVVVVTGLGVITSLGAGKADNWAKLTAGQSGIRAITRFATDGLKTKIAGTVDFLQEGLSSAALTECFADLAAEEAIAESGIGTQGFFPGPLFLAVPPIEVEWPQRLEVGAKSGANDKVGYADLLRVCRQFPAYHDRFLLGSVADHIAEKFGTQGSPISLSTACASGATAIQLGVEAIRRGETEAALCMGTDGSINPEALIRFSLLSALSTSHSPRRATASSWRKAPAPWCWKATIPPGPAALKSSA
jgi:3-oxoacyl-[acyl-carrier-protein] synthase II